MTITQGGETPQKLLRVWPAIVIVLLLWVSRFGVKAVIPGIEGFGQAMMGSFAFTVLLIIWWAFFSRARWKERIGALGLMAAALGAAWLFRHESMWVLWLVGYAVPILSLAFVLWAVITRKMPDRIRHATMAATIVIVCLGWLLARQNGINGDHVATFGWRFSANSEEKLLADGNNAPAETTAPATATAPAGPTPVAAPAATASPEPGKEAAAPAPPATQKQAEWPGFRGPKRDGVVRGVKIKTDWSSAPPVQLWKRPIGPGWS